MSTYSDHEQRLLDQQSGAELDRQAQRREAKSSKRQVDWRKPPRGMWAYGSSNAVDFRDYSAAVDEIERLNGELQNIRSIRQFTAQHPETAGKHPCGCLETYPQLQAGRINHGPGCPARDPEAVAIVRCRCGGFPRPTLMGRTICSVCGQDVPQPSPVKTNCSGDADAS